MNIANTHVSAAANQAWQAHRAAMTRFRDHPTPDTAADAIAAHDEFIDSYLTDGIERARCKTLYRWDVDNVLKTNRRVAAKATKAA